MDNSIISTFFNYHVYWCIIAIFLMGIYIQISSGNFFKKLIGLSIMQTAIFLFYISISKINNATAPVYGKSFSGEEFKLFSNPLPNVLILTGIVVGIATLSVACALLVRIKENYNTIETDEIDIIEGDLAFQNTINKE